MKKERKKESRHEDQSCAFPISNCGSVEAYKTSRSLRPKLISFFPAFSLSLTEFVCLFLFLPSLSISISLRHSVFSFSFSWFVVTIHLQLSFLLRQQTLWLVESHLSIFNLTQRPLQINLWQQFTRLWYQPNTSHSQRNKMDIQWSVSTVSASAYRIISVISDPTTSMEQYQCIL